MALELSVTYVLNLAAIIIIGVSTLYGAKTVKKLYSDEFATTINWILIIIEALFLVQLVIFLTFYFGINVSVTTLLVMVSTIFVSMLFFFATYKILHFLEIYTFEAPGEIPQQTIEKLMKIKSGKQDTKKQ